MQGVHRVTVQRGDTLWGISKRDLGDGARWPEIYQLSVGAVSPDGHVLTDPNVDLSRDRSRRADSAIGRSGSRLATTAGD